MKAAATARRPGTATSTRRHLDTLATRVYRDVRDAIVTLRIPPGVPLSEADVSRRFGGSRTPVRTALARLQREGLLVASNRAGKLRLVVTPLTAEDMRQLFLMVGALNGLAARLAAELRPAVRRPLVAGLKTLNRELKRASENGAASPSQVEEVDRRFHQAYERVVSAPQLVIELDALAARRTRYIRVYTEALLHGGNLQESYAEHEAIIDAIASGDPDAAERVAGLNHRQALRRFGQVIEARGEHGAWF